MEFKLKDSPEYCPGAYEFHAYCKYENPDHGFEEFPHIPTNCDTRYQALTALRNRGWRIHKDDTATCPKCMSRLRPLGVA